MRIRTESGQVFTWNDTGSWGLKIILNESAAKLYFPDREALGEQRVEPHDKIAYQVVGSVSDSKYIVMRAPAAATGYVPTTQDEEQNALSHEDCRASLTAVSFDRCAAGYGDQTLWDALVCNRPPDQRGWNSDGAGGAAGGSCAGVSTKHGGGSYWMHRRFDGCRACILIAGELPLSNFTSRPVGIRKLRGGPLSDCYSDPVAAGDQECKD